MELTNHEVTDILDIKYIDAKSTGYTFPPAIYKIARINLMLKSLIPDDVNVNITFDDIRPKSKTTTHKTIRFTEKSFFYTTPPFFESHSGVLVDIPSFVQLVPGSYKSNKPLKFTGIDKVHLKCGCINGSIVNCIREPICFLLLLVHLPAMKIIRNRGLTFLNE